MKFETIHNQKYTIRYVEGGPVDTQQDVWNAICEAVEIAFNHFGLKGHLFVTVVGADTFSTNPEDCGFALYHQGIQHVAVAGGDGPDEFKSDRASWLKEIRWSTIHEIVHYWQELQGSFDGSDRCENEAESLSEKIVCAT